MGKFYLLCLFYLLVISKSSKADSADSVLLKRYMDIALKTGIQFVPDQRTDVFSVRFSGDTLLVETSHAKAHKSLLENIQKESGTLKIVASLLPAKELKGNVFGLVSLSVANNRRHPDHDAEMVTQSLLGTPLEILKKKDGFYLVRTPDRYISWLSASEVQIMGEADFKKWKQSEKVVYHPEYGHSYTSSSKKSLPVSDLVAGDILELAGKKGRFVKVKYPDNRIAYILKKDVTPFQKWISRPDPDPRQIIKTAFQFVGIPYLWGGTSIKGMDCSGFTKNCYFLNGIILSRDASQQAATGEMVDISEKDSISITKCLANLRTGDLLFFAAGKSKSANPKVTHTAIYIGNGEFIQAAGLIRVNSLIKDAPNYDEFQSRTLVGARRILTAIGTEGISRVDKHPSYITLSN